MHFTTLSILLPTLLLLLTTTLATPIIEPFHTATFPEGLPRRSTNGTLLPRDQNIGKNSHLTIKFFMAPACGTSIVSHWDSILYNDQIFGRSASFTLSRDLADKEVLDFSTGSGVLTQFNGMEDATGAGGSQYPGPGYMEGGFLVPSQCDSFFWNAPALAKAKGAGGHDICYTPPKAFNCARLWMKS